jgi:hypothetical protein
MARLTLEELGLDQGLRAMVLKVSLEMQEAAARIFFLKHSPPLTLSAT